MKILFLYFQHFFQFLKRSLGIKRIIENEDGFQLRILVVGENLTTVRNTVDDLLACLGAIESTLNSLE